MGSVQSTSETTTDFRQARAESSTPTELGGSGPSTRGRDSRFERTPALDVAARWRSQRGRRAVTAAGLSRAPAGGHRSALPTTRQCGQHGATSGDTPSEVRAQGKQKAVSGGQSKRQEMGPAEPGQHIVQTSITCGERIGPPGATG